MTLHYNDPGVSTARYSALLFGFDAVQWAGVELFKRDGTAVSAPALGTMQTGGYYPDAAAFLNGWASQKTLTQIASTAWTTAGFAGSWSFGMGGDGLVYGIYSGPEPTWHITSVGRSPLGFEGVGTPSGGVVTAANPWTRGTMVMPQVIRLQAGAHILDLPKLIAQSVSTLLLAPGTADNDAVTECLEKWDNNANDNTNRRIRWGIDDEGLTWTAWPTALGDDSLAPTWTDHALAAALGFTGFEVPEQVEDSWVVVSTMPALGVQIIRSRMAAIDYAMTGLSAAGNTLDGTVYGRPTQTLRDTLVSAFLRGGMGFAADSGYQAETEIYRIRVAAQAFRGARCQPVPTWGDPRIGQSPVGQFGWHVAPVNNSAAVVAETDGVMGRRRGSVTPDSGDNQATFAPNTVRIRTAAPMSWRVRLLDG